MLNSAEHELSNAHKYENSKKLSISSGSDKPRMLFFLLINVTMPTICRGQVCISLLTVRKNHGLIVGHSIRVFYGAT